MASGSGAAKRSWPELVGTKGEEAAATIMRENPSLRAHTFLQGSPQTDDFRFDRVRVWTDDRGVVIATPEIG